MGSSHSVVTGYENNEDRDDSGESPQACAARRLSEPPDAIGAAKVHLRLSFGPVHMHRLDVATVAAQVRSAFRGSRGRPLAIGSVNLDHVYHFGGHGRVGAAGSAQARDVRWLMLIDGAPVASRARNRTRQPWPRLTGADLLPDLLSRAVAEGARVGFLGGTASMSRALLEAIERRWPDLDVAGVWTPPRAVIDDPDRSAELAADIAADGVDLLVVGLGKPRQERWIARHGAATGAKVLTAFGAAAGFLAGTEQRAPLWMQRLGVEWMYRLASEPRRLWRRYLVQGPIAMTSLLRAPVTVDYVELRGGDEST